MRFAKRNPNKSAKFGNSVIENNLSLVQGTGIVPRNNQVFRTTKYFGQPSISLYIIKIIRCSLSILSKETWEKSYIPLETHLRPTYRIFEKRGQPTYIKFEPVLSLTPRICTSFYCCGGTSVGIQIGNKIQRGSVFREFPLSLKFSVVLAFVIYLSV